MPRTEEARTRHLDQMQRVLEEGLKAIAAAGSTAEANAARDRARSRLESIGFRSARVDDDLD